MAINQLVNNWWFPCPLWFYPYSPHAAVIGVPTPPPTAVKSMTLGRTKGFAVWSTTERKWKKNGGMESRNFGLSCGFLFWSESKGQWLHGGVEMGD